MKNDQSRKNRKMNTKGKVGMAARKAIYDRQQKINKTTQS